MHELSIALRIVDIAEEETRKEEAAEVSEIDIEVGTLSGVVIEALEFAMEEAKRNSVLEQADIHIHEIPAIGKCNECNTEFEMSELYELCPNCQSMNRTILRGQELQVKSLKVR